ncbi:lymphocyte cytosolic protein 2-like isoform X2 [Leptopilina boulardi]|uniref:lymphocyte cytosolic protein 2-like isoform X2 n=1 Tax=Leptopilina boulardi TaxID=63433 RepID=UPI0021F5CCA8|nr:lymphocyte cytosolic protein 2-like isoform X2 [Leptopilina boulardi]
MSKLTRSDALEEISNWSKDDVENLLRKNGLEEECCKAIDKRNIGGDELLHLTEGKLALWKSDLTRPLIWSLWSFVEELRKNPIKYVEEKREEKTEEEEDASDTDSWATDFDDEIEESVDDNVETKNVEMRAVVVPRNLVFRNSLKVFQDNDQAAKYEIKATNVLNNNKTVEDNTYANYDIGTDTETTYANCEASAEIEVTKLQKNESKLHSISKLSLAQQLKEQLMLRDVQKPTLSVKPKVNISIRENSKKRQPQTSFLHTTKTQQKTSDEKESQKRLSVSSLPESLNGSGNSTISDISVNKNLPKPPGLIRSFDLVANLPTRTEESEDEYEPFDEEIIEQHQRRESMARVDSKQSLTSGHQSSIESVYQPPSITSHEEEKEYEIYEYITESPEETKTDSVSTKKSKTSENPPPLPVKPPNTKPDKLGVHKKDANLGHFTEIEYKPVSFKYYGAVPDFQDSKTFFLERSPDKKFATLPHSGSNSSLSLSERATRPLPPPPDRQSYTDKIWFHNVTREQAMILIREQSTYGNNPQDGYFLVRPSISNPNNPLTLVLWYKDRVYNVPIRKRIDNRFALGSEKVNEQSFASVEEIVPFYSREELFLYTGGMQMGSTKLSDTPLK